MLAKSPAQESHKKPSPPVVGSIKKEEVPPLMEASSSPLAAQVFPVYEESQKDVAPHTILPYLGLAAVLTLGTIFLYKRPFS